MASVKQDMGPAIIIMVGMYAVRMRSTLAGGIHKASGSISSSIVEGEKCSQTFRWPRPFS
jgi:hypothetical protein